MVCFGVCECEIRPCQTPQLEGLISGRDLDTDPFICQRVWVMKRAHVRVGRLAGGERQRPTVVFDFAHSQFLIKFSPIVTISALSTNQEGVNGSGREVTNGNVSF